MMPWTRDRHVHAGPVAAVVGGARCSATSWVIVATTDRVSELEARVFAAVNRLPGGPWPVVWVPMQLGSLVGSLAAVGVTWLVGRDRRLTLAALIASQTGYWAAKGVKRVVSRERPGELLPDVLVREHASGLGYLSGHSAVAFALATVLAPSLPRRGAARRLRRGRDGGVRADLRRRPPAPRRGRWHRARSARGHVSRWAFGLGGDGVPPR